LICYKRHLPLDWREVSMKTGVYTKSFSTGVLLLSHRGGNSLFLRLKVSDRMDQDLQTTGFGK
jgi:hypothetical protein